MFAALLASLALAGAPATTPITCHPDPLPGGAWGLTDWNTHPVSIRLFAPGCGAALYASASKTERVKIRRLNPNVNFPELIGRGLLLDLHESEHVGLQSKDECLVENTAYARLPQLLSLVEPTLARDAASYAAVYHQFILTTYACTS